MNLTLFTIGKITVTYRFVVILSAIAAGIFVSAALYTLRKKHAGTVFLFAGLDCLISVPLSRLIYLCCNPMLYSSLVKAMFNSSIEGMSLIGAFAGTLLAVLIFKACGKLSNTGLFLDCVSIGAVLSISVGRLSAFFSTANRSKYTLENSFFQKLPFMIRRVTSSGSIEWRIATFALESVFYCLVFIVFLIIFLKTDREKTRRRDGDLFLAVFMFYCSTMIVFDSTRYDALYFRANGFVSITQILCLLVVLFISGIFLIRLLRNNKRRLPYIILWTVSLAFIGVGGYMEYYVQRHGQLFITCYLIMGSCFLVYYGVSLFLAKRGINEA